MDFRSRFTLSDQNTRYTLISIVMLDKMLGKHRPFSTMLEGDDTHLEEVVDFLIQNGVLDADPELGSYIATPKGRKLHDTFSQRYTDFVRIYDVFCAVDLGVGEFGHARFFDYPEDVFANYLMDERFTDLRVTVAEFKEMSPFEIVFMAFLKEKRFREPRDRDNVLGEASWQYQLIHGSLFQEIVDICNSSPHFTELGYEDDQGVVSGEDVIKDVITQGVELSRRLHAQLQSIQNEEAEFAREEARKSNEPLEQTVEVTESYWEPYWDPYYRSPVWDLALVGLILL